VKLTSNIAEANAAYVDGVCNAAAEVETGLSHGKGAFIACSFWLLDPCMIGR
jgi:hypothetical protein